MSDESSIGCGVDTADTHHRLSFDRSHRATLGSVPREGSCW
jgi:hypothetical protein